MQSCSLKFKICLLLCAEDIYPTNESLFLNDFNLYYI